MSLSGRRRQSAADKARNRRRRAAAQREPAERPCAMRGCQHLTSRPLGYCDRCWNSTP